MSEEEIKVPGEPRTSSSGRAMPMQARYRKGRRGPSRSALGVVRQLDVIMNLRMLPDVEVGRLAGVHPWTLSLWRQGVRSPTLQNVEAVAGALGHRLVLESDETPHMMLMQASRIEELEADVARLQAERDAARRDKRASVKMLQRQLEEERAKNARHAREGGNNG